MEASSLFKRAETVDFPVMKPRKPTEIGTLNKPLIDPATRWTSGFEPKSIRAVVWADAFIDEAAADAITTLVDAGPSVAPGAVTEVTE